MQYMCRAFLDLVELPNIPEGLIIECVISNAIWSQCRKDKASTN